MKGEQINVAVVVVAHRMYETLEQCLDGFKETVRQPEDLIFVDNGSGGSLTDWAKQRFPGITLITLMDNRLFCGGYNAGIRHAMDQGYQYVLIANADTEVINQGFISVLLEAMERHPRAAFIGPLVFYRNRETVQTTCLHFPSVWRSIAVWLPYRFLPSLVSRQSMVECEVEFLNGVCVLCRCEALRQIGLMDESFGAYVEDTDWSWRARARGWTSVFVPVPSLVHHEEPHGYEHYSFKSYLLKRNTVYWYVKVGKPLSARVYAWCATSLARFRACMTRDSDVREASKEFASKLQNEYRRLLSGPCPDES